MIISIADQPGTNSNVESLIETYKKPGTILSLGIATFFPNFIPDFFHVQWPGKLYTWYPFSVKQEKEKIRIIEERLKFVKSKKVTIIHPVHNIQPHDKTQPDFEKKSSNIVHHCKNQLIYE